MKIIIRHADVAFGKKHWYMKLLQEIGSVDKLATYLNSGPGFKAWTEAREFTKDVDELQKSEDFTTFESETANLEQNKQKLSDDITRISERLRRYNQDVDELQSGIDALKKNFEQWTSDAKLLI